MDVPGVALHGGGGSKVPGYFEEDWTLLTMLDLLSGHADRVQLEVPGQVGWGFEFWIGRDAIREWHQVKFQNSNVNRWSIEELASKDVLESFRNKLATEANATCWFVSADGVAPLDRLCDRADHFPDFASFESALTNEDLRRAFKDLRDTHWKLSGEETWDWLKCRVFVEHLSHRALTRALRDTIRIRISGDPTAATEAVRKVKQDVEYVEIDAAEFEQRLNNEGFFARPWWDQGADPAADVRAAAQSFRTSLDDRRINGLFLPRDQIEEIKRLLSGSRPPRAVLVTGLRGYGKSAVMSELVAWALGEPWEILALDTASLSLEKSASDVGSRLQLPDTPAATLSAAAASGGRGLFIIDALDWLALDRDKPAELFKVIDEVIQEALRQSHITVVISCRSEDLDSDVRLRGLVERAPVARQIDIPRLSDSQVDGALAQAGVDRDLLTPDQWELLRVPICLKYLSMTPQPPYDFATERDLKERWLDIPAPEGAQ